MYPFSWGRVGWECGEKEMSLMLNILLDCPGHTGDKDNWAHRSSAENIGSCRRKTSGKTIGMDETT